MTSSSFRYRRYSKRVFTLGDKDDRPINMSVPKMIILLVFMLPVLIIAVPCFYFLKLCVWLASGERVKTVNIVEE